VLFFTNCGTNPDTFEIQPTSSTISIFPIINKSLSVKIEKLIIQISGPEMDTIRDTADSIQEIKLIEINNITPGKSRHIEGWTLDNANTIQHYGNTTIDNILPGENKIIRLDLLPKFGTIQIGLSNIPKNVDSIFASFYSTTQSISTKQKASYGVQTIEILNIPDKMQGTLFVYATDTLNHDTIFKSEKKVILFDATKSTTINIKFTPASAHLEMTLTICEPGTTLIISDIVSKDTLGDEKGELIISEIMYYAAGDSDYIELYNPGNQTITFDTFIVQIIGGTTQTNTINRITNISIPAKDFYVIGNGKAPAEWADNNINMAISSTEKWIILRRKDNSVIDLVSYLSNQCGWPTKKSKYSIILDSLSSDPEYNNFGTHWMLATSQITGSDHFGTPGKPGN